MTAMPDPVRKALWNTATLVGIRRLTRIVPFLASSYRDTIFYFNVPPPSSPLPNKQNDTVPPSSKAVAGEVIASEEEHHHHHQQPSLRSSRQQRQPNNNSNNMKKKGSCSNMLVALTIDDGLSRGGAETSLVPVVLDLLRRYDARATFFVCTKYCCCLDENDDNNMMIRASIQRLLEDGHELGNHLDVDAAPGYYSKLSQDEFAQLLDETNAFLDKLDGLGVSDHDDNDDATDEKTQKNRHGHQHRWFRAPQGVLTRHMRDAVTERNMIHVLGDCYCDDWAFTDPTYVAKTMLRQVRSGSIVILHMPERGFRESSLLALEMLLEEFDEKGIQCVTLSEMKSYCEQPVPVPDDDLDVRPVENS